MEICMGMIGMQPSEFWNATVIEIHCAIDGFTEFHTGNQPTPMTKDELNDLMERYPD
tara:strand:- start:177 stop:347 length:171 start_codon:yes stop_codon:yes gene_type:complete